MYKMKQLRRWTTHINKVPTSKVNDPSTWLSYSEAQFEANRSHASGIGFMLGDGYVGVDIDQLTRETIEIVYALRSYTEWSPSGKGVHVIINATKPKGARCRYGTGIEIYDNGRYFTVTENQVEGTSWEIEHRQHELDILIDHLELRAPAGALSCECDAKCTQREEADDSRLICKALNPRSGIKFASLWSGNIAGYRSPSEADLAFCGILAYWGGTEEQIDRLFRRSFLMRTKWLRDDYREATIRRAMG